MTTSEHNPLRILVFGMGAIGTYVGGSLALAGHKVTYLEKPEVAMSVNQSKISIQKKDQIFTVPEVEIATSLAEVLSEYSYDFAILAVKSFDTLGVIEGMKGLEDKLPPILCLQNGVENEGLLESALGTKKVIAGTVTTAVGKAAAGQIVVEKQRGIGITTNHPLSLRLIEAFNHAGMKTRGYTDARAMKWSKMVTNLLANASSAILDFPPSTIFAQPGLFEVEMRMVNEALAVMKALKIPVTDLPGTPVRALVWLIQALPGWLSRPLLYQALGKGRGRKMPSFHIDLYAGRQKSEVEFLNGAVGRFGRQVGVPTPVNDWLTLVLTHMASGVLPKETLAHQPARFVEWVNQGRSE